MVISHFINVSIEILIYFLVSILCLFIGRKVLDWITPYDLNNQTSIEKNLAAGITEAGFYIAMAIIVHASVSGVVDYDMFSFIDSEDPSRYSLLGAELITTAIYLLRGIAGLVGPFLTSDPVVHQNSITFWLVSSIICCIYGMFYLLGTVKLWRQ